MQLEKGDVIFADMGSENTTDHTQKGWRPVLVLEFFPKNMTCTAIPITSQNKKRNLPTHICVTKEDIPVLNGDNTILCENCTTINLGNPDGYRKLSYNVCQQNPRIWRKIIRGLSVQLSQRFDACGSSIDTSFRRGSIVHIKDVDSPVIVVSNDKNNTYSMNLTVAPLPQSMSQNPGIRSRIETSPMLEFGIHTDKVKIINIPKNDVLDGVGFEKRIANQISKRYIDLCLLNS